MESLEPASAQRILIVDDSPKARLLIASILRDRGYEHLTCVDSAEQAFSTLGLFVEKDPGPPDFDLILMDLLMPEIDGLEACRRIRACTRFIDVPVIMVTAEDSTECLKNAFDAGAVDYVRKPVNRGEMLARVQSALRLKQETDCRKARELELVELTEKLRRLSMLDGLTGIANRRSFDDELVRTWRRSLRGMLPVALIMSDIDHFKKYNDQYGHLAGDKCLRTVAHVLEQKIRRPFDLVARYGGEEFAVLLPDTDCAGAGLLAEEMRRAVESLDIQNVDPNGAGRLSISSGVAALVPQQGVPPEKLIAEADARLYEAKRAGRNRVISTAVELSGV